MTEPQKDHNRYCNVSVCCANIDGICGASLELCGQHSSLDHKVAALESQQIHWKIRKDGDPKRTQEILQVGQQKLPRV